MFKQTKLIIVTSIAVGIFVVILFFTVFLKKEEKITEDKNGICMSPTCIHSASTILKNMDLTVDPCDDFYQFACGSFMKNTYIPDDEPEVTLIDSAAENVRQKLKDMIEEPIREQELEAFQMTKIFYRSCMNTSLIEETSLKKIRAIMGELGGWPVLERDWNVDDYDWKQSVYKMYRMGYSANYFMEFDVAVDLKNTTRHRIHMGEAHLGLHREFLVQGFAEKSVNAYFEYMVDIAVFLGANKVEAAEELKNSLNFEIELAKITLPKEKTRNYTLFHNLINVDELQTKYPSIYWLEYINTLLAPDNTISAEEVVVIKVPKYLTDFEILIGKTPKRVQANYAIWRVIKASVFFLNEAFRKRKFQYTRVLSGETERNPRWKECIEYVEDEFSVAVGALYIRNHFDKKAKDDVVEMFTRIRSVFVDILRRVDWMDIRTKKNAIDKATSVMSLVAYPDELLDDEKLQSYYQELEINENDYLGSALNVSLFWTRIYFKRLRQPVKKMDWTDFQPTVINAFYIPWDNGIHIPAGILQGFSFDSSRPQYMNYATLGSTIGHEITHGFDDEGSQFDKYGNVVNWWDSETEKAYLEKVQCIVEQYGNFTVPELNIKLNGIDTQGENTADIGGIEEAYLAYKEWSKQNELEESLPGLAYTPNQMFWISAANYWCEKYRLETLKLYVLTDSHAPASFRVTGMLSNSEYFVKDFNCASGSRMNPGKKCKVW